MPCFFLFLIVILLRYESKTNGIQNIEHSIKLEDARHDEDRFFFGMCPVSLKTASTEEQSSSASKELKVTVINDIKTCFFLRMICLQKSFYYKGYKKILFF